jgi:hypothetical protein
MRASGKRSKSGEKSGSDKLKPLKEVLGFDRYGETS